AGLPQLTEVVAGEGGVDGAEQEWCVHRAPLRVADLGLRDSLWRAGRGGSFGRRAAMACRTGVQSPRCCWRDSRVLGYQWLVQRPRPQRQSGMSDSKSQTGTPRAPARWPAELSMVTTTSNSVIRAASSSKLRAFSRL